MKPEGLMIIADQTFYLPFFGYILGFTAIPPRLGSCNSTQNFSDVIKVLLKWKFCRLK